MIPNVELQWPLSARVQYLPALHCLKCINLLTARYHAPFSHDFNLNNTWCVLYNYVHAIGIYMRSGMIPEQQALTTTSTRHWSCSADRGQTPVRSANSAVVMANTSSQATVQYSYDIGCSQIASNKTYSVCDGDRSAFSDVSDTELSKACDVLMARSDGLAQLYVPDFSDISDKELSAASQAFEDSCVKQSTVNVDSVANVEFSDISDCELVSASQTYENEERSSVACVSRTSFCWRHGAA